MRFDLLQRYPDLLLALTFTECAATSQLLDDPVSALYSLPLDKIEILYLFGLNIIRDYAYITKWLHETSHRRLILLEEDMGCIKALLDSSHAEAIFLDPQIVIHYFNNDAILEEIASTYPCDRIEVIDTKKESERFSQVRLKIYRHSTIAEALLTESLSAHELYRNVVRNIARWEGSFLAGKLAFRAIPAIICGAGPSLQKDIGLLKTLEDRALIIAGGSAITALTNQGVHPHLGIAFDPNAEEFERFKAAAAFEMPLVYGTRLHEGIFHTINGERGYLISGTGGPCERYFETEMGLTDEPIGPELGAEALSVTTLAIAFAVHLGCNPIILDGVDLAYTDGRHYADGIEREERPSSCIKASSIKASERTLKRTDIYGNSVETLVKWVMESESIAAYTRVHPEVNFINATQGGLGINAVPRRPLSEIAFDTSYDLRALVHAEIQTHKLEPFKQKISNQMQVISESLHRLKEMSSEMLIELKRVQSMGAPSLPTGKMAILESDFQQEPAFSCLFPMLGVAIDKLRARSFVRPLETTEEEEKALLIQAKIAKWQFWQEVIDADIALF